METLTFASWALLAPFRPMLPFIPPVVKHTSQEAALVKQHQARISQLTYYGQYQYCSCHSLIFSIYKIQNICFFKPILWNSNISQGRLISFLLFSGNVIQCWLNRGAVIWALLVEHWGDNLLGGGTRVVSQQTECGLDHSLRVVA